MRRAATAVHIHVESVVSLLCCCVPVDSSRVVHGVTGDLDRIDQVERLRGFLLLSPPPIRVFFVGENNDVGRYYCLRGQVTFRLGLSLSTIIKIRNKITHTRGLFVLTCLRMTTTRKCPRTQAKVIAEERMREVESSILPHKCMLLYSIAFFCIYGGGHRQGHFTAILEKDSERQQYHGGVYHRNKTIPYKTQHLGTGG